MIKHDTMLRNHAEKKCCVLETVRKEVTLTFAKGQSWGLFYSKSRKRVECGNVVSKRLK